MQIDTGRPGDRVYILQYKLPKSRRFFFYMQNKDASKDDEHCSKINEFMQVFLISESFILKDMSIAEPTSRGSGRTWRRTWTRCSHADAWVISESHCSCLSAFIDVVSGLIQVLRSVALVQVPMRIQTVPVALLQAIQQCK
jgi:hypothetical protein